MSHNILITGASGYLGGTLLDALSSASLPAYNTLYALVRTEAQAQAVKKYGALPLFIDLSSPEAVTSAITSHKITIVYHLHEPRDLTTPTYIEALAQVKKETGHEVHFLFTTGAKLFSEFAGAPTDRPLLDNDPALHEIHKAHAAHAPVSLLAQGVQANTLVVDTATRLGVRSYIFAPCIVYGPGRGFGNKISIQTVAVVKAAKGVRRMYKVDKGRPTWPVCHVDDNAGLYVEILRGILNGKDIGHGEKGYFLAASGSMAWDDIYAAMGKALKKRGVVDEEEVAVADEAVMEKMGEAMECPGAYVPMMLGGLYVSPSPV